MKKIFIYTIVILTVISGNVFCQKSDFMEDDNIPKRQLVAPRPDVYPGFYTINNSGERNFKLNSSHLIQSNLIDTSRNMYTTQDINNEEKVLVIPLEFTDVKFSTKNVKKKYENLMEEVRKYYELNSGYEKDKKGITIDAVVIEPITSKHTMAYYGEDNNILTGEVDNLNVSIDEMAREAVEILKSKGFNFAEFDKNQDEIIDHIIIIHAGAGQEETLEPDLIWSHRWEIQNDGAKLGDKIALNYTTVPENATLGVIVHEFGHDLGLPDLYDTSSIGEGIGSWDLMASGSWNTRVGELPGSSPSNLSAWSREFLGWNEPVEVEESCELVFNNDNGISNLYKIYLRDDNGRKNKNEYYLIEYRRKINYDEGLPGEGILIWHIDLKVIDKRLSRNEVNNNINRLGVELVQADGKFHLKDPKYSNRGDAGDPFPGDTLNYVFGAIPHGLNFSNEAQYSFIEIKDFKLDGNTATAHLNLEIKEQIEEISTYAPLNEVKVGNDILFSFDMTKNTYEYKLQISEDEEFLLPMQYNINSKTTKDMKVKNNKITFSKNFKDVLEVNKEYYWRVSAVNPKNVSDNVVWSVPNKFIFCGNEYEDIPSNFEWKVEDDRLTVSWIEVDDVDGYIVSCDGVEYYTADNKFSRDVFKDKLKHFIKVRSVGNFGTSHWSEELTCITSKIPQIRVETNNEGSLSSLPTNLILKIENGEFKKNGNYNKSTVTLDVEQLPDGIEQGDVIWIDKDKIKVRLSRKDTLILEKNKQVTINVSKYLINNVEYEDLKTEVIFKANNENYNKKINFSFDGIDAGRLIGIRAGMEYSLDGGITYNICKEQDQLLTEEELSQITEFDGILIKIVSENNIEETKVFQNINIFKNKMVPALIQDYEKKMLYGLTSEMEYSLNGDEWNRDIGNIEAIEGDIFVRYAAHGRVKNGDSIIFNFEKSNKTFENVFDSSNLVVEQVS